MEAKTATGWAVTIDGTIAVSTVYQHRRGAILNWLVTAGIQVSPMWNDAFVDQVWAKHKQASMDVVEIVMSPRYAMVEVRPKQESKAPAQKPATKRK